MLCSSLGLELEERDGDEVEFFAMRKSGSSESLCVVT